MTLDVSAATHRLPVDLLRRVYLHFHKAFWTNPVNQLNFVCEYFSSAGRPIRGTTKLRVQNSGSLTHPKFDIVQSVPGRPDERVLTLDHGQTLTTEGLDAIVDRLIGGPRTLHHRADMLLIAAGVDAGFYSYSRPIVDPRSTRRPRAEGPRAFVGRAVIRFLMLHDIPIRRAVLVRNSVEGRNAGFGGFVTAATFGEFLPEDMYFR